MTLEFHHFFVFVTRGAPVVDMLRDKGFTEGSRNTHPGQGTSNRRIFFQDGMLEFIWIDDPSEARSRLTAPTRLWERSEYRSSGYSPFGICVCPPNDAAQIAQEPFTGWAYRPRYLPPGYAIWNGSNDDHPWEPMIFYLPFVKPFGPGNPMAEPTVHPNGAKSISRIRVTMRDSSRPLSPPARAATSVKRLALATGTDAFAEIRISGTDDATIDLSPWCPLKIILHRG